MLVKFKQNIYKLLELIPLFKFTILPYYQFIKYKRKTLKTIIPNLKKQLIFTKPHNGFEHKKGPIVTFVWMETEHYGMYAMLILAKALQVRGADVNILVCNQTLPTCECMDIDNYRTDVCRICKLNQEHLLPLFNVKTTYLGEYISQEKIEELKQRAQEVIKYYPAKYMYHGIDLIPIVQSSIMRHYYGSWPESEKEFAELRYKHLLTAMITTNVSIGLKEKINPDIIIGQTWVYSMYAPFYQYFKISQNQKVLTLGMGGYHYKAFVLNDIDTFHSKDGFYQYLKAKNHKSLDEKERLSLRKFMDERFYGVSDYHKDHGEFKNNKEIEDLIGIDKRKKNIFLFPAQPARRG